MLYIELLLKLQKSCFACVLLVTKVWLFLQKELYFMVLTVTVMALFEVHLINL